LLDAEGGPEGLHVHKGNGGGTSHMISQEERESSEFFQSFKHKTHTQNLQKELMQIGNLQNEFDAILDVHKLPLISQNPLISKLPKPINFQFQYPIISK
jgi:hypothetical protein